MQLEAEFVTSKATRRVMAALGEAYFVGGCVRNALFGLPVADIDLATPLLPDEVMRRAEAAGLKVVPTGLAHGTVTLVASGVPFEVTTFRRDVATDGRRATIAFSDQMAEDAARRDFTINALYADASGKIIDPLGGLKDIAARHLRFVGDAEARIREDYLRILRYFRFHAWYAAESEMDAEALGAIAAGVDGLSQLSRERVTGEVMRLLEAPKPMAAVEAMDCLGILTRVLPGADPEALAALIALEPKEKLAADPVIRLAALAEDASALRLSRKEAEAHRLIREGLGNDTCAMITAYRHGVQVATGVIVLRAALKGRRVPKTWRDDIARGASVEFPVKAADLPGFSGPPLGRELARLKKLWLEGGAVGDREAVLALASPSAKAGL